MGQEVYHLKGSQIQRILLKLLQRQNFARISAVSHYFLNQMDLFIYLFNL